MVQWLLYLADNGDALDPVKLAVGAWFDRWLAIVKPEVSPTTHLHYQRAVESYLKPRLGIHRLAKLSRAHVQQLFTDLAKGGRADGRPGPLAASTHKQLYLVLDIALGRAVDLQMIGTNVAHVMRRRMPKIEALFEPQVLDADQSAKLLDAARAGSLFAPILLALSTGCRRGEAVALTWSGIDLDRGLVTLASAAKQVGANVIIGRPKSGKSRVVSVGANATEELRAWRRTQAELLLRLGVRQSGDTPVCTRADGSSISPNALTIDFWRLAKRLGMNVHYHSLRHGHATALLLAGVHPKVAQERLGITRLRSRSTDTHTQLSAFMMTPWAKSMGFSNLR